MQGQAPARARRGRRVEGVTWCSVITDFMLDLQVGTPLFPHTAFLSESSLFSLLSERPIQTLPSITHSLPHRHVSSPILVMSCTEQGGASHPDTG